MADATLAPLVTPVHTFLREDAPAVSYMTRHFRNGRCAPSLSLSLSFSAPLPDLKEY